MSRPDKSRQHRLDKFYKAPLREGLKRNFVVSVLNHSDGYAYQTLPRTYPFKHLAEVNGDLFCVSLNQCG